VFVTVSAKTVDRIIEQRPHEARYFAGFVAWEDGELSKEIEAGQWLCGASWWSASRTRSSLCSAGTRLSAAAAHAHEL
jgi:hypothetical protein